MLENGMRHLVREHHAQLTIILADVQQTAEDKNIARSKHERVHGVRVIDNRDGPFMLLDTLDVLIAIQQLFSNKGHPSCDWMIGGKQLSLELS